jgi:hypothetical protein
MRSEEELSEYLPLHRIDVLAAAIGRRLVEVERLFTLDVPAFLAEPRFQATDFFARNSGPTQFRFEGDLIHVLDVWGEQLSLVVLDAPLVSNPYATLYALSQTDIAPPALQRCLGQTCLDVRVWTLSEELDTEEAREVAVSYVLSGNLELFYCIYLHGDLDSDYLLLGQEIPRQQVEHCFSVARREYINGD